MSMHQRFREVRDLMLQGRVTATLLKDATNGKETIPKGTRVMVWMVSRFWDVGINQNLKGHGYTHRVGSHPDDPTPYRNPGPLEEWLTDVLIDQGKMEVGQKE